MEVGAAIFLWAFIALAIGVMFWLTWYACSGICEHCWRSCWGRRQDRQARRHRPLLHVDDQEDLENPVIAETSAGDEQG